MELTKAELTTRETGERIMETKKTTFAELEDKARYDWDAGFPDGSTLFDLFLTQEKDMEDVIFDTGNRIFPSDQIDNDDQWDAYRDDFGAWKSETSCYIQEDGYVYMYDGNREIALTHGDPIDENEWTEIRTTGEMQ